MNANEREWLWMGDASGGKLRQGGKVNGRGGRIRTGDFLLPKQAR